MPGKRLTSSISGAHPLLNRPESWKLATLRTSRRHTHFKRHSPPSRQTCLESGLLSLATVFSYGGSPILRCHTRSKFERVEGSDGTMPATRRVKGIKIEVILGIATHC